MQPCIIYVLLNREENITEEKNSKRILKELHSHHPRRVIKEAEVILTRMFPELAETYKRGGEQVIKRVNKLEELEKRVMACQNTDIENIDIENITDIKNIKIDRNKTSMERILAFFAFNFKSLCNKSK